jgi:signal transduction histidine kinase
MEDAERFPRLVSLACHDLRSPLATAYGFARTLARSDEHDERTARYLGMIEAAAEQMAELLDSLGAAARIMGGRFEATLREVDTRDLVQAGDERIVADGTGTVVETDADAAAGALRGLALAGLRHGPVDEIRWRVDGRVLELAPVTAAAAPVVTGDELRDLGALVGRMVLEALGARIELDGESLRVSF